MPRLGYFAVLLLFIIGCSKNETAQSNRISIPLTPYILVLGIAQDAGYPQMGCKKQCCNAVWKGEQSQRFATSLALIDPTTNENWLFEATPDIKFQLQHLNRFSPEMKNLKGVFLTHAHIGHYTGLIHFGKEVMGAKNLPVYAMPRMADFLAQNGPWSQLVSEQNISIKPLQSDKMVALNSNCSVTPILVPHRDEYSETVGFKIAFGEKKALFIPDIDKWSKWNRDFAQEIQKVDYAFIDATFFGDGELPGRDMSQIPHPFVEESMALLKNLSSEERAKVHFIHLNHTNPLLNEKSPEYKKVLAAGFKVALEGGVYI
ncbi:MAG: pyrroloquinoline quinone biosynthesis protein PqqB [Bacteroidetes bacterium]|nr:pyrroloquinoline quinone biosynthesis protein PqqB [Bacteroidota bacterium]